jgi:hypothetical protein
MIPRPDMRTQLRHNLAHGPGLWEDTVVLIYQNTALDTKTLTEGDHVESLRLVGGGL